MDDQSALAQEAGPEAVIPEAPDTGDNISTEGQTDGQAAEGAEEAAPEDDTAKSAAKERREREKQRVARLAQERDAALEEARKAEDRLARIKLAAEAEKPPSDADYPDPFDLVAAKAIWAARRADRERDAGEAGAAAEEARRRAEEAEQRQMAEIGKVWRERVDEARKRYADFDAVALTDAVAHPKSVALLVATSDVGPDVAYYLGQNRALAAEIAALNPVEQARAIGRIEATISAPRPRQTTTAPPPITPVRAKAAPTRPPEDMSPEEYAKWRAGGGTFKLR